MKTKKWYVSRTIMLGTAALLAAVADGISNGYDWRQVLTAALGVLIVYLRTDTDSGVTR